jgi:hypothetical protein
MSDSIAATAAAASPDLQALVDVLGPSVREILEQVQAFRRQPPTPEQACAFERQLAATLRSVVRQRHPRCLCCWKPCASQLIQHCATRRRLG